MMPITFNSLDLLAEIQVTEHNRPHWFQPGAAIFVTFRTADSLPKEVILRWQAELQDWCARNQIDVAVAQIVTNPTPRTGGLLAALPTPKRHELQRLSSRIMHRSLDDCHGACLLKSPDLAHVVTEAILHYEGVKYDLDSFVIMPNHVHSLVQLYPGADLRIVSQSWMRYTGRQINRQMEKSGPFWQPEPFDHVVRSGSQMDYLRGYIRDNPRKAKLRDGEFLYWHRAV